MTSGADALVLRNAENGNGPKSPYLRKTFISLITGLKLCQTTTMSAMAMKRCLYGRAFTDATISQDHCVPSTPFRGWASILIDGR